MTLISNTLEENTAVLRLNNGIPNAINTAMLNELSSLLAELEQDTNVHSLILTSSNDKIFSLGFDLPQLIQMQGSEFPTFFENFNRICLQLYTFPKPVVAALNGHAIAGGTILAMCCDWRYLSAGKPRMGLNEVQLGITVPWPAEVLLRNLVGHRWASKILLEGALYPSEALLEMGLVDFVVPLDEIQNLAMEKAKTLSKLYNPAWSALKLNHRREVVQRIEMQLETRNQQLYALWNQESTQLALAEAAGKF